jgi:hypothetical protein
MRQGALAFTFRGELMVRATHPIRAFSGRIGGIPENCRRPKQYRFGHAQSIRTRSGYIDAAFNSQNHLGKLARTPALQRDLPHKPIGSPGRELLPGKYLLDQNTLPRGIDAP